MQWIEKFRSEEKLPIAIGESIECCEYGFVFLRDLTITRNVNVSFLNSVTGTE
jgi:hypothetical protein